MLPRIDNGAKLLFYLGGSSFNETLRECDKYLDIQTSQSSKKDITDLSNLHNSLMNELIISIVNFIELICKEAESTSNRIHKYFKDVSDVLNENGRENYLFKCFVIPDDEVRLSLVNCILQVPQKQLDYQEISNLMKTISESKNIGAGKAEEIFSTIFLILINLVTDTEQPAFKNFRIKDGSNAIFH